MKKILTTLTLLASLGTAHAAEDYPANVWMNQCDNKRVVIKALCHHYAFGVAGGLSLYKVGTPENIGVCLPDRVTAAQLVAVAQKYWKDNPKERHNQAMILLAKAFLDAWPCTGGERQ